MKPTLDRDDIRRRALALIEANGWKPKTASDFLGVSETTIERMRRNEERWANMSRATVERIADHVARLEAEAAPRDIVMPPPLDEPTVIDPTTTAPEPTLPVARHTGMLNERMHDGQPVYTIADIAGGLDVHPSTVWRHWHGGRDEFRPGVDVVCIFANGNEQPLFTRQGVMLLSMSIGGDRAKSIRVHLRELESAVATGQLQPAPVTRDDKIDTILTLLSGRTIAVEEKAAAAEVKASEADAKATAAMARVDEVDPAKVRALFIRLDEIEREIEGLYKQRGDVFNFSAYRRKLKAVNDGQPVSRYSNSITVSALRTVVGVAETLLADERRRGVRIFDGGQAV